MAAEQRLICSGADVLESGTGVRFTVNWHGRETPAFVVRYRGRVHAYLNRCGHVPAELDWQPGEFFDIYKVYLICSIHGALYAPATGHCVSGRCGGAGLQPLPVIEQDGAIYLIDEQIHGKPD